MSVPTPNMSLPIPTVGVEDGPQYAYDVNSSLTIIDQHNHSTGSGVQITPDGININGDLTFGNNNLTTVRTVRFSPQSAALSPAGADVGSVYVAGVDLYFNDVDGNAIRLTQSGSIVGTAGSITGLPSGTASVAFNSISDTYVFESATNTAANLDGRNVLLRNSTASSNALTLQPPAAMGANYALTLPSLPVSTRMVSLNSSGVLATGVSNVIVTDDIGALQVTKPKLAPVGQLITASCGNYTTSSVTFVTVTNCTGSLTVTAGRPVMVGLIPDGTTNPGEIPISDTNSRQIAIRRDGTIIAQFFLAANGASISSVGSSIFTMDPSPSIGAHTYDVQALSVSGAAVAINNMRLYAYEL